MPHAAPTWEAYGYRLILAGWSLKEEFLSQLFARK